jgi:hypothetical protein
MSLEKLKFPIGVFIMPEEINSEMVLNFMNQLESFPNRLKLEIASLTDEQLDTPYRPEGWTLRQVIHHCADSHMNCFIRFKLALTENNPTIKPYQEDLWAMLSDSKLPIHASILILEGVHIRWNSLLRNLSNAQWKMTFFHPQSGKTLNLEQAAAMYSWHCNHHLGHIIELKKSKNWL